MPLWKSSRRNILLAGLSAVGALAATLAHRASVSEQHNAPVQHATSQQRLGNSPSPETTANRPQAANELGQSGLKFLQHSWLEVRLSRTS